MRHRILRTWLAALFCTLLLWSATSLVFSMLTVGGGASPVLAADEETASKAADPGGKEAATKGVEEKEAAKEPEKASAEKAASEKTPAVKDAKDAGVKNTDAKDAGAKKEKDAGAKDKEVVAKDAGAKKIGDKARDGAKEAPTKDSFLVWLYSSLGVRYVIIFLIITFNAVALIVMIVLGLRRSSICPDELVLEFETKLNEKQYQEAYELVKTDKTFLGKVLMAGMSKLSEGYDAAVASMQEVGEEQNMKLEQRNGYIALLAQIGPMFGLLGTVDGMVMAFDVISHSNVTPKPSELAQGIGTALVTTVVGLWIAIPMVAFYQIIRNRLARIIFETGMISDNLMKRFSTVQPNIKKA